MSVKIGLGCRIWGSGFRVGRYLASVFVMVRPLSRFFAWGPSAVAVMSLAVEVGPLSGKAGFTQVDLDESGWILKERVPIRQHSGWMCSDRRR